MKSTRLAAAIAFLLGCLAAAAAAKTMNIVQRGLALSPTSATLTNGDQLIFTNEDDVIHNIHIFGPGPDESVDLGLQKPGRNLSYRFTKPGNYRVRCNIHPSVKMSVVVK
ncbi:MAG TPA: plastocyanin/azurin family copper-binding protein [Xanthobacteraceae bacterium]|nr:plastocyanin/azurin family copper-binding protein [Xanthobacteraceae bacterium]